MRASKYVIARDYRQEAFSAARRRRRAAEKERVAADLVRQLEHDERLLAASCAGVERASIMQPVAISQALSRDASTLRIARDEVRARLQGARHVHAAAYATIEAYGDE